jgi:hypothetical protein
MDGFLIFHMLLIDLPSSVWSSLDNSRDISKYNYFISKPNYLTSFLITTVYPNNYVIPFVITISYPYNYFTPFLTHQHGYEKTN